MGSRYTQPEQARAGSKYTRGGGRRSFLTEATQVLNEVNKSFPFADEVSAGAGALTQTARDLASGRGANLGRAWTQERQQQNAMSADLNARRPNVAAVARGVGNAGTIVIPTGGAALPAARASVNMARGATAALASSGVSAAADSGNAMQRFSAASRAVNPIKNPTAAILGAAGGRLTPTAPSTRARVPEPARRLIREGVQLTPGQARGGLTARLEDAATSAPLLGQSIQAARTRGNDSLNRVTTDRALRPIGGRVPDEVATGNEAIAYAGNRFNDRYQEIVPEIGLNMRDPQLGEELQGLSGITSDMTEAARGQLQNIVNERVIKRIQDGKIDGATFKRIESELSQRAGMYTKSPDPDQQSIGQGIQFVTEALRNSLARQSPSYAKALGETNKGYSRLATLETAAGKQGAVDGIVTPKALREAYRAGDKSVRRRATAQGRRSDQDFYDAGSQVMPSQINDSGTATRAMNNPLALGAMGTTAVINPAIGVPAIAGLLGGAAAYSKPAMDLFNKALQQNVSKMDKQIAIEQLGQLAVQNPQLRGIYNQAVIKSGIYAGQASQSNAMVVR